MKTIYILVILTLVFGTVPAQNTAHINYQGVAKNNDGSLLINQGISLRVSYLLNLTTNPSVYQEKFDVTTNALGYFDLKLGTGSPLMGSFALIDWSLGTYFIKTEIDPTGGNTFTELGISQLGTVPHAYFAKKAGSGFDGTYHDLTGKPIGQNTGDMLYWNGNQWISLPIGQPGQVLKLNDSIPQWDSIKEVPHLTTFPIAYIYNGAATSGGIVSSKYADILQKGICWSTMPNPTVMDFKTEQGTGIGSFSSTITGLVPNVQYYYRAYATNSYGTGYGADLSVLPTVNTDSISTITYFTALVNGNAINQGSSPITERGFCFSTIPNPTVSNSKIVVSAGLGAFSGTLTGLIPNTTYYIRAYASSSLGNAYGEQLFFTTPYLPPPTLTTDSVQHINYTNVLAFGNITNIGGIGFSEKGFCYGTAANPSTANTKISVSGTNPGLFSASLSSLTSSTTYHVRAYVINQAGTFYGNDLEFSTLIPPTITTLEITNYTTTSAVFEGFISSEGSKPVIERGICYGLSSNPTLSGTHVVLGNGPGPFSTNIAGLSGYYYIRAYATTEFGTFYGNQVNFSTSCTANFVKTHTVNGIAPVAKTVTYFVDYLVPGEPWKCWLLQNLGADHQATSVNDATEESAGWYWQFSEKQGFKHTGSLRTPSTTWKTQIYFTSNWAANIDPCRLELGGSWRLPTSTEWTNVKNAGMWTSWNEPWNSILKLHAAGALSSSNGSLTNRGTSGYYWSSSNSTTTEGVRLRFTSTTNVVEVNTKATASSVRCLKTL